MSRKQQSASSLRSAAARDSTMSSRRREPPIEDSWRMVEGENESFDTTILPPSFRDDDPMSSGQQPSSGYPSQNIHSQGLSLGSQDSIRDFSRHQDDDNVILREPFRPSLPQSRRSENSSYQTPDPQFRMPMVDFDGEQRRVTGRDRQRMGYGGQSDAGTRRRGLSSSKNSRRDRNPRERDDYDDDVDERPIKDRIAGALPTALFNITAWILDFIGMVLRMAKRPLALFLAIYISFGAIIMAQNLITNSVYSSLSPICRVPGVGLLNLPFCPNMPSYADGHENPVEFDDLMSVQGKFEQVLEKSAEGVSLPYEMKRSEATIRDLRTLVRHSDITAREELVFEFDGYIESASRAVSQLSRFNIHVGNAVDSVLSINRWTSRYIDSLAPGAEDSKRGLLSRSVSWLFFPFQPTDKATTERIILDKYIEHTAFVSERITTLILEAQAVLDILENAEGFLSKIYEVSSRSADVVLESRDKAWWDILSRIAGTTSLGKFDKQLRVLRHVDSQRSTAVAQINALILELESIQAGLGDLRDRVSQPEVLRSAGMTTIPLTVHIETIDSGVERLEAARARLRADEEDRVREALLRGGVKDELSIEGR